MIRTANTMTVETAIAAYNTEDDWDLVVGCLHWAPKFKGLGERETVRVLELADGMGSLRGPKTNTMWEMLWDWSHVRDSSPRAVAAMAAEIRRCCHRALRKNATSRASVADWERLASLCEAKGDHEAAARARANAREEAARFSG